MRTGATSILQIKQKLAGGIDNPQQNAIGRRAVSQIGSLYNSRDNSPNLAHSGGISFYLIKTLIDYGANVRASLNLPTKATQLILKPNLNRSQLSQSIQRRSDLRPPSTMESSIMIQQKPLMVPRTQQNSPRSHQPSLMTNSITHDQGSKPKKDRRLNQSVDLDYTSGPGITNISVQDIIKSNMRKTTGDSVFGIAGYHMPNTNIITQRPRTTKFTTYNIPHFIDKYAKSREFVPGPKYETIADWKSNFKARGMFSKSPRVTFTEGIIKETKLLEYPGPGMYQHDDGFAKKRGGSTYGSGKGNGGHAEKVCEFIEEAKFMGTETPAPKYDVNYTRVDADLKYARIKPSKVSRMDKIEKNPNKPAPGDYNMEESYSKTQTIQKIHKIGGEKIRCFIDEFARQKNFLPGIGSYKVETKAYNLLSKSPKAIRTLRH